MERWRRRRIEVVKGVFCPTGSRTARMLAQTLGVQRVRGGEVLENLLLLHPPPKEAVIRGCLNDRMCWGKLRQHIILAGAGLPTLQVAIFPPREEERSWIPRSAEHSRGDDFNGKPVRAAYFTKWEEVEKEFRFHIVGGNSIKAGGKMPRLGMVHPTIRSGQFGWAISYGAMGREGITKEMRKLAKEAAAVCQMDAGVVDVWKLRDGRFLIGELNVRPGMDQPTVNAWAEALKEM